MATKEKALKSYEDPRGKCPFEEWLERLKDIRARAIIRTRLARVRLGNLGNCEPVGEGVLELKVQHGPGYRVYFGQVGKEIIVLLCGGDKSTQNKDIKIAKEYWKDYRSRNHG